MRALSEKVLILDGAIGTEIMKRSVSGFDFLERLNLTGPDLIRDIHKAYIDAGSDIISTNTFGGNRIKLDEYQSGDKVEALNVSAAELALEARGRQLVFIAGSMGPVGKLTVPLGDLPEESVFRAYAEQARALEKGGVDFLLIETQIDLLEARLALSAAVETTALPVALSFSFPMENKLTVTGSSPEITAIAFSGKHPMILGINCGGHPESFEDLITQIRLHSKKPLMVYANAGIPEKKHGRLHYSLSPESYASHAETFHQLGAAIIGGCCGTTPAHIQAVSHRLKGKALNPPPPLNSRFRACGRSTSLILGGTSPLAIVGENINPFGRSRLRAELEAGKLDRVRDSARKQKKAGATALDINLGQPGEKKPEFFAAAVRELQAAVQIPLFFDNSNPETLEAACRSYPGRAVINSANGRPESYESIFPLAKKHGAGVVMLAMDENGVAETAEEKVRILTDLREKAFEFGLSPDDLLADPAILTLSTSQESAFQTLLAIEQLRELGFYTVIGLSNLSFGLPHRPLLHASFISMAASRGLDTVILNPLDTNLMDAVRGADAITGRDSNLSVYLISYGHKSIAMKQENAASLPPEKQLFQAIIEGEKIRAGELTQLLLDSGREGLEILESVLSPALRQVGRYYEQKRFFLPQLILAAEAMEEASALLQKSPLIAVHIRKQKTVVMATVKGDLHDIGKNIVSLVLRNFGFRVIDLGKDVDAEKILSQALDENADFIGLSALMTTTMEQMSEVISLRDRLAPHIKILVGGAAVTASYARRIGADIYGKDAMDTINKISLIVKNIK